MSSDALRERHIDRLLAEELEASVDFATWFVQQVFGDRAPIVPPSSCSAQIGFHRQHGETDIPVQLAWPSGSMGEIHIEDKLAAMPQPDQALRYQRNLDATTCSLAASALVAPEAWMRRHPQETAIYDVAISFETLSGYFQARAERIMTIGTSEATELVKRLRWRENLFRGTLLRRSVHRAIHAGEITEWNRAAAEVIAARNGLSLAVTDRQQSERQQKESRFLRFQETLSSHPRWGVLRCQTENGKRENKARVSLEVPRAWEDAELRNVAMSTNWTVTCPGRVPTLMITGSSPLLEDLTIAKPVEEQISAVEAGADVAQELIEWWEALCSAPNGI